MQNKGQTQLQELEKDSMIPIISIHCGLTGEGRMEKEKCRKQQRLGKAGRKTNNSGGDAIKTNQNFYFMSHH